MQILRVALLMFVATFIFSCGKRKADLDNSLIRSYDGKTSSASCKNLDLTQDLLKKDSVLKIFGCIGWKDEFPNLYLYLNNLSATEFKLIFEPINNELFGDRNKRNELLNFIQDNVNKSEIKDISEEIRKTLKDETLLNVFSKVSQDVNFELPSKHFITSTIELLKEISKSSNKKKKAIKNSLNKLNSIKTSKKMFDALKLSMIDLITAHDSKFLKNTKSFIYPNSWPTSFLKKYTTVELYSLITYANKQSGLFNDLSNVQSTISLNLNNCHEFNSVYQLDYQVELDERLRVLASSNKVTFLMDIFELSQRFSLFNNICPYETFNKTSSRVLSHMRNYAVMPGGYEFLKALANTSITEDDLFLIFSMIQSDAFDLLGETIVSDEESNSLLLKNIHELLKEYDSKMYERLSTTLLYASEELEKGHLIPFQSLSIEEKLHITDTVVNDILLDKSLFSSTNLLSKFMKKYGNIYSEYEKNFTQNKVSYAFWINELNSKLKDSNFKNELIKFLDEDVFFKLVTFISRDKTTLGDNDLETGQFLSESKDEISLAQEKNELIKCLVEFNEVSQVNYDFWYLLDNYPKVCVSLVTKKSLASHIFQWTLEIDKVFNREVNDKFSYNYGMIAPEMMSFYHSLMHIINTHLDKNDSYVSDVISSIRKELFENGLIEILQDSSVVLNNLVEQTTLLDKSLNLIINTKPKIFDATFKALLKPISFNSKIVEIPKYHCLSANPSIGGNTCFSQSDFEMFLSDISDMLARETGAKTKLYESLINFIFGEKGIRIPFDSKKQRTKNLDLDELVRFLFDMTDKKTQKKILFRTKNIEKEYLANRAERLEIVIREISFLNNFYGAFFMNSVSRAKKYYKKVKSMKKNVSVMDSTAGFFRRRGFFPEETSWAFKNIMETFSSLYELELSHKQPDGGSKRYGDFIQAVLTMVVETSSYSSQKYTPLQAPKPTLVKDHNGMFITRITDLSFLSQMGLWLRKISDNNLVYLVDNEDFKLINSKLSKLISPEKAKDLFGFILTNKNRDLLIKDLSTFIFNIKERDSDKVSNILWSTLKILARGSSSKDGDKLVPLVKMIVKNYHLIREYDLLSVDSLTITQVAEHLSKVEQLSSSELKLLVSAGLNMAKAINLTELDSLLKNKNFIDILSTLKTSLLSYLEKPDYNSGFMTNFLMDKQLNFTPLQKMLIKTYAAQGDFTYIKNIIKVLSLKSNDRSNIEIALREIFDEEDEAVFKFLTDMFNKFSRPSIQ